MINGVRQAHNVELFIQNGLILDACTTICLCASNRLHDLLRSIPSPIYISTYVLKVEINALYNPATKQCDIPINLDPVIQSGLLLPIKPTMAEAAEAVNIVTQLNANKQIPGKNTGEAVSGAIAKSRQLTLATDDIEAADLLSNAQHQLNVTSTMHLIERWSRLNQIPTDKLRDVLMGIKVSARYVPNSGHPLHPWWTSQNI